MRNLKITNHMKKITYSNISKEKLDEFFSSGYNKRLKDKCKGAEHESWFVQICGAAHRAFHGDALPRVCARVHFL